MGNWQATFLATQTQMSALAALPAIYAPATCTVSQLQTNRVMWALAQTRLGPAQLVLST